MRDVRHSTNRGGCSNDESNRASCSARDVSTAVTASRTSPDEADRCSEAAHVDVWCALVHRRAPVRVIPWLSIMTPPLPMPIVSTPSPSPTDLDTNCNGAARSNAAAAQRLCDAYGKKHCGGGTPKAPAAAIIHPGCSESISVAATPPSRLAGTSSVTQRDVKDRTVGTADAAQAAAHCATASDDAARGGVTPRGWAVWGWEGGRMGSTGATTPRDAPAGVAAAAATNAATAAAPWEGTFRERDGVPPEAAAAAAADDADDE